MRLTPLAVRLFVSMFISAAGLVSAQATTPCARQRQALNGVGSRGWDARAGGRLREGRNRLALARCAGLMIIGSNDITGSTRG